MKACKKYKKNLIICYFSSDEILLFQSIGDAIQEKFTS